MQGHLDQPSDAKGVHGVIQFFFFSPYHSGKTKKFQGTKHSGLLYDDFKTFRIYRNRNR